MSFTTGGLYHQESLRIAVLYLEFGNWNEVRKRSVAGNILRARTTSSLKRTCREICLRLKTLTNDQIQLLVEGTREEQCQLLWLATCRQHLFIKEFACEVIRERCLTLRYDIHYEDFDAFFNSKAQWHDELDHITPTTRDKLRQVLFRILREAGFLTHDNIISAPVISPRLLDLLSEERSEELCIFPMHT